MKNYIIVELKAINKFTDSPIHTGFLDYLPEDSLIKVVNFRNLAKTLFKIKFVCYNEKGNFYNYFFL